MPTIESKVESSPRPDGLLDEHDHTAKHCNWSDVLSLFGLLAILVGVAAFSASVSYTATHDSFKTSMVFWAVALSPILCPLATFMVGISCIGLWKALEKLIGALSKSL